jgi:hypothetical protein
MDRRLWDWKKILKLYVFGIVYKILAKNVFLCMLKTIFVSWDKFLYWYWFISNSFVSVQNDLLKFYFLGFLNLFKNVEIFGF